MQRLALPSRAGCRPRGFTRVEFVMVMIMVAVLVALVMPAIQARREESRRAVCGNHLYQLGFAAQRHADHHGFLPGWRNDGPSAHGASSWPIVLLPFIERNDLFRAIAAGQPVPPAFVSAFACPSSLPQLDEPVLAYAGNCGSGSNLRRADGVMLDTTDAGSAASGRLTPKDIADKDGTTHTLLLAEKCGPGTESTPLVQAAWSDAVPVANATSIPGFSDGPRVYAVFGIVGTAAPPSRIINAPTAAAPGFFSQPSSNHRAGAMVARCDVSTAFLSGEMSAGIYAQLLSWDDEACRKNTDLYAIHDAWVSGKPAVKAMDGE